MVTLVYLLVRPYNHLAEPLDCNLSKWENFVFVGALFVPCENFELFIPWWLGSRDCRQQTFFQSAARLSI